MKRIRWLSRAGLFCLVSIVGISGCGEQSQTYEVQGVYLGPAYGNEAIVVDHERIPGYMEPMRMTFRLSEGELPPDLPVGESIRFRLTVRGEEAIVDRIEAVPGIGREELAGQEEEDVSPDTAMVSSE